MCVSLSINPTDYDMADAANDEPPQDRGPLYMHVVCAVGVNLRAIGFVHVVRGVGAGIWKEW